MTIDLTNFDPFADMRAEDESKVYPVDPVKKRIFSKRENELYALVRKRGLTVQEIIERSNATSEEIIWMWELDRMYHLDLRRNS